MAKRSAINGAIIVFVAIITKLEQEKASISTLLVTKELILVVVTVVLGHLSLFHVTQERALDLDCETVETILTAVNREDLPIASLI